MQMNNELKTYSVAEDARHKIAADIRTHVEQSGEVVFAVLFGSFVAADRPDFRDIDIAVYFDPARVPADRRLRAALELGADLERRLPPYPVDILVLNDAPLAVAFRATQGEPLFARDGRIWIEFVTRTWSLYHDHALTSRHVLEELLRA